MSISNPSLQNQPADDLVRGGFVARPGKTWITCDYSQVESRLIAHFSQDAGLIEAFRKADEEGSDFFCEVGGRIYREPISKDDKRRGFTKNTFYGMGFGAGVEKMAQTAGVPVEQMQPVRDGLLAQFPGMKKFMEKCITEGRENAQYNNGKAFIMTPTGRRLVVEPGHEYALINRLVQGHAAEVLKEAALRADNAGLGDAMRIPVHDELLLEVDEADAEEARHTLQTAMEDTTSYRVPLYAHADIIGHRWKK
jgi:DNA polymerase-1